MIGHVFSIRHNCCIMSSAPHADANGQGITDLDMTIFTNGSQNDISQPISELVDRCNDHDRALVDMRCTLNNALNDIDRLKNNGHSSDSLSPDTTVSSDKSSILLLLDNDYPCPAQPQQDPGDSGRPADISTASVGSHMSHSTDTPTPVNLSTPDCSFSETNQSLTSLLCSGTQTNPRNPPDYQDIGPHSGSIISQSNAFFLQMDTQSVFDKIMSKMHDMNENYVKLETRVSALEAWQSDSDNLCQPLCDELSRITQSINKISVWVNKLKTEMCNPSVNMQCSKPSSITTNSNAGTRREVPSIPCSNRFAALQDDVTDEPLDVNLEGATQSDTVSTSGPARHRQSQHTTNTGGRRRKGRRVKAFIVGSSLVRGLGNKVNDNDFDVCCKCFPDGKIENIAPWLPKVTREYDDVIVIAAGSNNIPSHDVATIIRLAGEMIDDLHYTRPNTQLVIPAIPRRYDDPDQSDIYRQNRKG